MLLMSLRGTIFIYQGEELGLPDVPVPADRVVDAGGRDPQRAPITWEPPSSNGPGAGFTNGAPWLPITDDAEQVNADTQRHERESTLNFYRRLIAIRRDELLLVTAPHRVDVPTPGVLRVINEGGSYQIITLLNFGAVEVPVGASGRLLSSTERDRVAGEAVPTRLCPREGIVLRLERERAGG